MVIVNYRGIASDDPYLGIVGVRDIVRPFTPVVLGESETIPGKQGEYDYGFTFGPKVISCRILVGGSTLAELRQFARRIASWLQWPEVSPLTFSDETGIQYQARLNKAVDAQQIVNTGQATIEFRIPEGVAEATSTKSVSGSPASVSYEGTAEAPMIVTCTMQEQSDTLKLHFGDPGGTHLLLQKDVANWDFVMEVNDVVEFNTANHMVKLNGVDARAGLALSSDWRNFKLPRSMNPPTVVEINAVPASTSLEVVLRERWV